MCSTYYCALYSGIHIYIQLIIIADYDECSTNGGRGPCKGSCTNTAGGYTCSCPAGKTLNSDGVSCDGG